MGWHRDAVVDSNILPHTRLRPEPTFRYLDEPVFVLQLMRMHLIDMQTPPWLLSKEVTGSYVATFEQRCDTSTASCALRAVCLCLRPELTSRCAPDAGTYTFRDHLQA